MSKKKKYNKTTTETKSKIAPTQSKITSTKPKGSTSTATVVAKPFLFHKQNYILILAGLGLILLGLLLMAGGHMPDNNTWDEGVIYSTRRTLLAPIVILAGIGVEIYAIFKK